VTWKIIAIDTYTPGFCNSHRARKNYNGAVRMFGIGLPELIVILGLALIVVGPDKLPDLARSIAKGILDLKKTAEGIKEGLTQEGSLFEDLRPDLDAVKTLKKELAKSTDIDWQNDTPVSTISETSPDTTNKPSEAKTIEQKDATSLSQTQPAHEKKRAAVNESDKPASHLDHHS
jgi:sec-independent protein translocase protein TatB